ncbi:TPA: hypothetical protein DDZ10_05080, partial [Candidatus Uhrbacteria bacterium]|nr:hypothetical protein [Candidatus Uhrbacteria bacterium]
TKFGGGGKRGRAKIHSPQPPFFLPARAFSFGSAARSAASCQFLGISDKMSSSQTVKTHHRHRFDERFLCYDRRGMNLDFRHSPLLTWADPFLSDHPSAQLYVVGGAVRDAIRGRDVKDVDLVIGGVKAEALEAWLGEHGTVSFVGKRFGVWKFAPHHDPSNPQIDIALPRKDVSIGGDGGYRQFLVESDPNLPIEEDLARRDFTVNAIAYDWRRDELVDPFGGQSDLKAQLIRAVGNPALRFREDSSRLLRALRFACTLGFSIEEKTWSVLKQMTPRLSLEAGGRRIVARELMAEEFVKTLEADPARCIELYQASGAWNELFSNGSARGFTVPGFIRQSRIRLCRTDVATDLQMYGWIQRDTDSDRRELLFVLLCYRVFKSAGETYDWLHLWRFETVADVKAVVAVVRAMQTDPRRVNLAQIERQLLPYRELFSQALIATNHPHARQWLDRLILVQRTHDAPPLLERIDLTDIPDGPKRGEIVNAVRSAQLAGEISTREEALALLKQF